MLDDADQETVLCLYLDALIARTRAELAAAESRYKEWPSAYTVETVKWLAHKLSAFKEARRDADAPGQIISRFLKAEAQRCRRNPN